MSSGEPGADVLDKRWLMNSDPGRITSHWGLVTYLLEHDLDVFVCPCVT